jgi:YD repeat-containing protein
MQPSENLAPVCRSQRPVPVTRRYYDPYGEPTSTVDAGGNATRSTFDSSGNLTQVNAPNGGVTRFKYQNSNLIQAYNTTGQVLVQVLSVTFYDDAGQASGTEQAVLRKGTTSPRTLPASPCRAST